MDIAGLHHRSGPVDAQFAACGSAGFWGNFCSLEMLFSLGWVSLISSQKTKYLKAFRGFCSNRAVKSRLLKETSGKCSPELYREPSAQTCSLDHDHASYDRRIVARGVGKDARILVEESKRALSAIGTSQQIFECRLTGKKDACQIESSQRGLDPRSWPI